MITGVYITALVAGRACERKRAGVIASVYITALVAGRACERKRAGVIVSKLNEGGGRAERARLRGRARVPRTYARGKSLYLSVFEVGLGIIF